MKVLFAADVTRSDEMARRFVRDTLWPQGSEIEVLGVLQANSLDLSGTLLERAVPEHESELRSIADSISLQGTKASWRCVIGHPASAIVECARAVEADLIVVGTRGHGRVASALLGSVSAAVIDRAPCPVLVAREATADRIVLADDGSPGASAAAALVQEWPIFGQSALEVVSVIDMGQPLASGVLPHFGGDDEYTVRLNEERDRALLTLTERGRALERPGRPVLTTAPTGVAAGEILTAARQFDADLIVVGSRGQTGLTRFFAGSVARQVLLQASCSVLIARGWAVLSRESQPRPVLHSTAVA